MHVCPLEIGTVTQGDMVELIIYICICLEEVKIVSQYAVVQ